MLDFLILGSGGHALSVLNLGRLSDSLNPKGYVSPKRSQDTAFESLAYFSNLDDALSTGVKHFANGVGVSVSLDRRLNISTEAELAGLTEVSVFARTADVSSEVGHLRGLQVFQQSVLQINAKLEHHVVIGSGAIVEHDVLVQEGAFIGPGSILLGSASIGRCALVGAGAVVLPGVRVGDGAVIGAGSVVTRDAKPNSRYLGSPAREVIGTGGGCSTNH